MFVRDNSSKAEVLRLYDERPYLFEEIGVSRTDIENANREQLKEIVKNITT